jgi:hypothetical protein
MANNIRERAKQFLDQLPPLGQQVNSLGSGPPDGKTSPLFLKLTNTNHKTLTDNWAGGGIMTTCNNFVGAFGNSLGAQQTLGRFDIEEQLKKRGKAHAWVKATSGQRPKYGDVFRPKKFHMGISLDFEGDMWNTAESGQGGSKTGYDIVKRKRQPWDPSLLQGWVDIEAYFADSAGAAAPFPGPVPDWLLGWWNVSWRSAPFYYYFERDGKVKFTRTKPQSTTQPLLGGIDIGSYTLDVNQAVTIRWNATGSIEKLTRSPGAKAGPMKGMWNDKEPINAVRL